MPGPALPTLYPGITVKNEREVFRSAEFVGRGDELFGRVRQITGAGGAFVVCGSFGPESFHVTRESMAAQEWNAAPLSDKE